MVVAVVAVAVAVRNGFIEAARERASAAPAAPSRRATKRPGGREPAVSKNGWLYSAAPSC